jgi:hypothetical protein
MNIGELPRPGQTEEEEAPDPGDLPEMQSEKDEEEQEERAEVTNPENIDDTNLERPSAFPNRLGRRLRCPNKDH